MNEIYYDVVEPVDEGEGAKKAKGRRNVVFTRRMA